jgi:hypothetical protein
LCFKKVTNNSAAEETKSDLAMIGNEYTFREADQSDLPIIAEFFRKHKYELDTQERLKWKYLENPAGRGRIFLIENSKKEIKGTLGYIPHKLLNPKTPPQHVMESVDLFFAPEARGKQMFPKIQGKAMKIMGSPLIAFPNRRSEKITIELGWQRVAPIEKWYFPIGPDRTSAKGPIGFILKIVKMFFKLYASLCLIGPVEKIKLISIEKFNHDFDKMHQQLWVGHSAQFLNWRFIDNPMGRYIPFEFHMNDNIVGYCVLSKDQSAAVIYDFFASKHVRSCLRKIVRYCSTRGYNRLIFPGVGLKLWRFGFIKWLPKINLISYNLPRKSWVLTLCDSDW